MQPEIDNEQETFSLVLLMLWECRNALADLREGEGVARVEQCIYAISSINCYNLY